MSSDLSCSVKWSFLPCLSDTKNYIYVLNNVFNICNSVQNDPVGKQIFFLYCWSKVFEQTKKMNGC